MTQEGKDTKGRDGERRHGFFDPELIGAITEIMWVLIILATVGAVAALLYLS